MKDIIKEFKEFALKGNVFDLAVGVVIGAAFGKIVSSLVNDVIMPPFSLVLGRVNLVNLYINLSGQTYKNLAEAKAASAATVNYGAFLNNIIEFILVAVALFLVIKPINKLRRSETKVPTEKNCPFCDTKIPIKATRCPSCTSQIK